MPDARVFKIENRLAKVVSLPGGKTVAEALAAADRRIAGVKDECIAALEKQSARLSEQVAAAKAAGGVAGLDAIYRTANEIFGVAGTFGLNDLGVGAYSLCDIADCFRQTGEVNWPAIEVHADGLRLLSTEADPAKRTAIVMGLKAVAARYLNR